ncbi:MAG: 2-amino-4-hydroxy-6-hydroxymethyldihydropteridine diphosphokinase [Inquilinaceae bacterium]
MTPVLFGLGSNLGDRAGQLRAALAGLRRLVRPIAISPVYETAPMYVAAQGRFLNMVVAGRTDLAPVPLLRAVKVLERDLGRRRSRRFGPRAIDIDILLMGCRRVRATGLAIPHPRMGERPFVLYPAADVAADWRHPITGLTIAEMAASLDPDPSMTRLGRLPLRRARRRDSGVVGAPLP